MLSGRKPARVIASSKASWLCEVLRWAKQVARTPVSLRAGADALSFKLPRGSAHRHAKLVLLLGAKTFVYRVVVP